MNWRKHIWVAIAAALFVWACLSWYDWKLALIVLCAVWGHTMDHHWTNSDKG